MEKISPIVELVNFAHWAHFEVVLHEKLVNVERHALCAWFLRGVNMWKLTRAYLALTDRLGIPFIYAYLPCVVFRVSPGVVWRVLAARRRTGPREVAASRHSE